MQWHEARNTCLSMNADLAMIKSHLETTVIVEYLKQIGGNLGEYTWNKRFSLKSKRELHMTTVEQNRSHETFMNLKHSDSHARFKFT